MATYIAPLKGYITDVPELWFRRKFDGRVYHFDQLTSGNVSPQVNFNEVNAGWSLYPVAYLPGQSTMEMSFESAQFDADLFAMANNENFEADTDYTTYKTEMLTVTDSSSAKIVTLTETPVEGSVNIGGLKVKAEGGTETEYIAVSGKTVTINSAGIAVGDEIEVNYEYVVDSTNGAPAVDIANNKSAVGELVAKWPVYATGDEETNLGGGVKGYIVLKIYKCRVTAMPGFDTSLNDGFLAQQCA